MTTTYTAISRAAQMSPLDPIVRGLWGPIANAAWVCIEQLAAGNTPISITGLTTYTLTALNNAPDQASLAIWNFIGALSGNCTVTVPPVARIGWACNSTTNSHNIILTTGSGRTVTLAPGDMRFLTSDGTNIDASSMAAPYILAGPGGGAALTNNPLQANGNVNSSLQAGVQNLSSGTTASSDFVLTSDDGTDTTNYLNLGINSSTNSDGTFTISAAHDSYIYSVNGDISIGTATAGKRIEFFTGGTMAANLRGTVTDTGLNAIPIGATTASTGAFTTLTSTGLATLVGVTSTGGHITIGSPFSLILNGAAGNGREIHWTTALTSRWILFAESTAESGSNAGSNLQLNSYNDAGGYLSTPFAINRATGLTTLTSLSISSTVSGTGFTAWAASPPPIGSTAANTGKFTSLTASGGSFETQVAMSANNIDLNTGSFFTKTIAANTTFTTSNVPASGTVGSFILELTNGSAFSVTWWSGIKWANSLSPVLSVSGLDVLGFYTMDGGTTWRGLLLGAAMA